MTDRDRLLAILDATRHAPSVLNTQPWAFRIAGDAVELRADRRRQLPALDPHGRELTVSCGAALAVLRVAALHHGLRALIEPFPQADDLDLLARVTFEPAAPPADDRLFRAIALRHTHRRALADEPIPDDLAAALMGAVAQDDAWLRLLTTPDDKEMVARLVDEAVRVQAQDSGVVADVRAWLRPDGDPRPDGVRDGDQGPWDRRADVRTPAAAVARHKARLIENAPAVAVLGTETDTPSAWLAAGLALGEMLLVAADRGLAVSYANEPIEVNGGWRRRLAAVVGGGYPQLLFRLGRPVEEGGTPRRPLRDVAEVAPEDEPPPDRAGRPITTPFGPVEARQARVGLGRLPTSPPIR
ncbi:Acg family FMN-binding oxidoreductase [Rubrivirga marina]|uniref:Uncharacterized protein n=1 Tax=Rubrivirga marina TaxID=1196024 RepID=A0A271IXE5_9BACT|nr:nitroreductase family protein [Rubrivirga marina]PAP75916.1 hypothetical protein BSZ37_05410 [Rubrivirga marina]